MTTELRELTNAELDETAGGQANLGGYTYCNKPGVKEGLYVGGCPTSWDDIFDWLDERNK